MNEETDIYQPEIPMDEEPDALLPDGYAEGDDFFEPDSWTGETGTDSASEATSTEDEVSNPEEPETAEAPAIEPAADTGPSADNGSDEAVPATDTQNVQPTKRRVRYQFDHEDREEEIDDADLPGLLQMARSADRYKNRLAGVQSIRDRVERTAHALKYDSAEAFLDAILDNAKSSEMEALRGQGVPDAIAEDYVGRKYADAASVQFNQPQTQQPTPQQPAPAPANGRDYVSEAKELLNAYPDLVGKELPKEVYAAVQQPGVSLLQAYTEFKRKEAQAEAEKARSDAEKLRKENRILKNNADSADRAPVSGVSKGGRADDKDADDPFMKGFNSLL